jgi:hypothetical protein
MSEPSNVPREPETPDAFGDRKGLIIGVLVGVVILGAVVAVVGHRDVLPVERVLGFIGLR